MQPGKTSPNTKWPAVLSKGTKHKGIMQLWWDRQEDFTSVFSRLEKSGDLDEEDDDGDDADAEERAEERAEKAKKAKAAAAKADKDKAKKAKDTKAKKEAKAKEKAKKAEEAAAVAAQAAADAALGDAAVAALAAVAAEEAAALAGAESELASAKSALEAEEKARAAALETDHAVRRAAIEAKATAKRREIRGEGDGEGGEGSEGSEGGEGGEGSEGSEGGEGGEGSEGGEWFAEASALAASAEEKGALLTAASPGQWAGKEGTHAPVLHIEPAEPSGRLARATVSVAHGQAEDHFIRLVWAAAATKGGPDRVLAARKPALASSLAPPLDGAVGLAFDVPADAVRVVAYASCNLHGVWASEPVNLAPPSGEL